MNDDTRNALRMIACLVRAAGGTLELDPYTISTIDDYVLEQSTNPAGVMTFRVYPKPPLDA
jgi:hypothetical protein